MSSESIKPAYQFTARELLDWEEDSLWELDLHTATMLTFDDGEEVLVNTADIVISWYFWGVAREFRELKITRSLFVDGRIFDDKLFRELLYKAIEPTIGADYEKEDVWAVAHLHCYAGLFNAICQRLHQYVRPFTAEDVVEIIKDPDIVAANNQVTDKLSTIDYAYDVIKEVMKKDKYRNNPLVQSVRIRTVKIAQVLQTIGPRGRTTEINSVMYRRPIRRGYAMGLDFVELPLETRSAAKAHLFNTDPVAIAEYLNRKLQLVCGVITHIAGHDCGTLESHSIVIPAGNHGERWLRGMVGMSQVLPNGKIHVIRQSDKDLLGQTIRVRSTMTCRHLRKQGVCETCYGRPYAYSLPKDTSPGHVSCTSFGKRATQTIISTKHLDFIEMVFRLVLRGRESEVFSTRPEEAESLFLSPLLEGKAFNIEFRTREAPGLINLKYCNDLNTMDIAKVSTLQSITVYPLDKNGYVTEGIELNVVKNGISASFSVPMLEYIKKHGWDITTRTTSMISVSNWDTDQPLFVYQLKHENMPEVCARIESFIRSTKTDKSQDPEGEGFSFEDNKSSEEMPKLINYRDPDQALTDAFILISDKMSDIKLVHIATMLAASRVADPDNGDWGMPTCLSEGRFAKHVDIIRHRSLGPAMLYQQQNKTYNDVTSYIQTQRLYSRLDELIYIPKR